MSSKSTFTTGTCPVNGGPTFDFQEASSRPCSRTLRPSEFVLSPSSISCSSASGGFPNGSSFEEVDEENIYLLARKIALFYKHLVQLNLFFFFMSSGSYFVCINFRRSLRFIHYSIITNEKLILSHFVSNNFYSEFFVYPVLRPEAFGKPATVTEPSPNDRVCPLGAIPFSPFPPTPTSAASFLSFRRY